MVALNSPASWTRVLQGGGLEQVPTTWAYWSRIRSNFSLEPMGFEQSGALRTSKNDSEKTTETQAERRERQALEIAAIVKDVIDRDFENAWVIAHTPAPGQPLEPGEFRLERKRRYMKYIGGVGQALLDAIGRLVKADDATMARALEMVKGPYVDKADMWDPEWRGKPDPVIGLLADRSPFDEIDGDDLMDH